MSNTLSKSDLDHNILWHSLMDHLLNVHLQPVPCQVAAVHYQHGLIPGECVKLHRHSATGTKRSEFVLRDGNVTVLHCYRANTREGF